MSESKSKSCIENKLADFEQCCRRHGLKVTPQRVAVYEALLEMDTHPTADEVHQKVKQQIPHISPDTVNRTLHTLSEIGAAFVVEGTGQPRRYDGGMEDHQHFLCIKCGRVIDFHYEPFNDLQVPDAVKGQFKILRTTVYLEGVCQACLKTDSQSSKTI